MAASKGENGLAHQKVENSSAEKKENSPLTGQKRAREGEGTEGPSVEKNRWPGWPGENVFRMIVSVDKVGSVIGRKGEFVKKIFEETKARVKVLDGVRGTIERVVLVNGREDPDAAVSPAMDALLRVHKVVSGIPESDAENANASARFSGTVSIRLLAPQVQAISLIGKQGSTIKSIQENSGATVRVLTTDGLSHCALSEDRVVEIQGEPLKVHKALELILGHLRKFLVDRSVLHIFDHKQQTQTVNGTQEPTSAALGKPSAPSLSSTSLSALGTGVSSVYKSDALFSSHDTPIESHSQHLGLSLYGKDPGPISLRSSLTSSMPAMVTQVIKQMQIPISYAEDIDEFSLRYIARVSGASVDIKDTRAVPGEFTVEIKGSESDVQTAQKLFQDLIARGHKKPLSSLDSGYGLHTQNSSSYYSSTAFSNHSLGGYQSYSSRYGY
eukprot:TRINITY_DN844_c0_g1_i1.p1 TRINITY_DN844_c0_g1~~TRINITY_DN844_c0_g1_i1.p1  ORF type:complete len:442 (-),score=69.45 TRINITY_DN844_c0_g1_i1:562-1887(-)